MKEGQNMEKSVRILITLFFVLSFTAIQFPSLAASADLIAPLRLAPRLSVENQPSPRPYLPPSRGKNTDVGDVLVRQQGAYLYVQYVIADPTKWCMTMTHLAVGASLGDIPQTHKGNPIPKRFPYKGIFKNGCGAEFTYKINIAAYKSGTTLFIAAHAYVRHQKTHGNGHVRHQETHEDEDVRHQETHEDEDVRHQETHENKHVRHQGTHKNKSAWAAGSYFPDDKRATYLTYTVQDIPR
jgi:Ni/Co efflux regulator RcnB